MDDPASGMFQRQEQAAAIAAALNNDPEAAGWRYSVIPTAPGSAWHVIEVRDETNVIVGYL